MDRRFVIWLLTTTLCLWLYLRLQPPIPQPGAKPPGANAAAIAAEAEKEPAEPLLTSPRKWWTLGSMNPGDGFNLLVTMTNKGAGIERIELTERDIKGRFRYRRTDVDHGYLGYFAADDDVGRGVRVNCVGRGTPADLARADGVDGGIEVGDRIVEVDGKEVESQRTLDELLLGTKPGNIIRLKVRRGESEVTAETEGGKSAIEEIVAAKGQSIEFTVTLSEHPMDLIRLESIAGVDQVLGNWDRLSCLLTLARLGDRVIPVGGSEIPGLPSQHRSIWLASTNASTDGGPLDTIEFRLPLDQAPDAAGVPIELVRRFSVLHNTDSRTDGYALDVQTEILNKGDQPTKLAYRLDGPNGMALEGWWYLNKISPNWWDAAGARDVIVSTKAAGHRLFSTSTIRTRDSQDQEERELPIFAANDAPESRQTRYIAVDGQYFAAGYIPSEQADQFIEFNRASAILLADGKKAEKSKYRALNTSFSVTSPIQEVAAGATFKAQSMQLFAGPKRPELLTKVKMDHAIEYGWFPFPAIPLSKILHLFNWMTGNYGLAIIMLTICVRALMFPLGRRAAIHAQKMQELAPELKKINEKFKDDMQKKMEAQRDLQRRVGFNPLSGCLPMFIQIPIFIGLYRCLSVDLELRQEPLKLGWAWCSNLAAPDMLYDWQSWMPDFIAGRGTGWLGPYFNLLPMIVVGLFLLQQKMFMPPATDEQTAMTQKVMNFMTIFMGVFFFKVPAGLCLYFITSSLWSIAERKLVKKTIPPATEANAGGAPSGDVLTVPSKKISVVNEQLAAKKKRRRPPSKR